eukprot:CAMPEP_0115828134 /NCGR_PEP_ID=MMETSP0287-20121206/415_1 /TAXON_ID=412157 /ORGANISM="Chrysochromulina rotalis, Strain UIO044" /LENGTH=116 /DNA_ID=CAMNT_0003281337 /DNA_START=763 /DNA_END=1114 /DNA_ORIENTATION=-
MAPALVLAFSKRLQMPSARGETFPALAMGYHTARESIPAVHPHRDGRVSLNVLESGRQSSESAAPGVQREQPVWHRHQGNVQGKGAAATNTRSSHEVKILANRSAKRGLYFFNHGE